jgi:hypothetical protein
MWLPKWLRPQVVTEVVYKVVEVSAPRRPQPWTKDIKDAIATLPSHPGFVAILDRLALQRQYLASKCANEFHKEQREADFLQSGVHWLNYVQALIDEATKVSSRMQHDPYAEELEAFQKIDAQIERVGMKD